MPLWDSPFVMGMPGRCTALLPVVWLLTGCCLEIGGAGVTSSSSGRIAHATTGGNSTASSTGSSSGASSTGSSTGGSSSGASSTGSSTGGTSTGARPVLPDAGTCVIDGTTVEAGDWFAQRFGSCTLCDPGMDPTGWTARPQGTACQALVDIFPHYPPDSGLLPITATCQTNIRPPYSVCTGLPGGVECLGDEEVCVGGFCNDAGQPSCVVTENLGAFSFCGGDNGTGYTCAFGICCMDAGTGSTMGMGEGEPEGWCCGLPDGGAPPCGTSGNVCADDSQCCDGLLCLDHGVYGTCE